MAAFSSILSDALAAAAAACASASSSKAAKRKLRRERAAAKKSSAKPHGVEVFDGVGSLLDRHLAFYIGKNRVALRFPCCYSRRLRDPHVEQSVYAQGAPRARRCQITAVGVPVGSGLHL